MNRLVGALTVLVLVVVGVFAYRFYKGDLTPAVEVTMRADRAGLLLDPGAKVSLRGVQVGSVRSVSSVDGRARITLRLDPADAEALPANVTAELRPTTLFGAKFVDLSEPRRPAPVSLREGDEIRTTGTSPEADQVFQNVMNLLDDAQPEKINDTLAAVSDALGGRGQQLGETITQFNTYLVGLLPGMDGLDRDLRLAGDVMPAYRKAAPDLITALDNYRTTGATLRTQREGVGVLLDDLTSTGGEASALMIDAGAPLTRTVRELKPTTRTLARYSPELPCLLGGLANMNRPPILGPKKYSGLWGDVAFLPRARPYQWPQDAPKVAADEGPNCYGLPLIDPSKPIPHYNFDVGRSPFKNGVDAGGGSGSG